MMFFAALCEMLPRDAEMLPRDAFVDEKVPVDRENDTWRDKKKCEG